MNPHTPPESDLRSKAKRMQAWLKADPERSQQFAAGEMSAVMAGLAFCEMPCASLGVPLVGLEALRKLPMPRSEPIVVTVPREAPPRILRGVSDGIPPLAIRTPMFTRYQRDALQELVDGSDPKPKA